MSITIPTVVPIADIEYKGFSSAYMLPLPGIHNNMLYIEVTVIVVRSSQNLNHILKIALNCPLARSPFGTPGLVEP